MIISNSYRFILVHVPKTAGASLKALIQPLLDPERDLVIRNYQKSFGTTRAVGPDGQQGLRLHSGLNHVYRVLGPERLRDMYVFGFVRNPYARAYSCHRFCRKQAETRKYNPANREAVEGIAKMSFEEVATQLDKLSAQVGMFHPQETWLPENRHIDLVGRTETLDSDMGKVWKTLKLPGESSPALPQFNVSSQRTEWQRMSRKAADAVREFYAGDFERFGYDTDIEKSTRQFSDARQ